MKRNLLFLATYVVAIAAFCSSCSTKAEKPKDEPIVVAYVTAADREFPDVTKMTHINYAFGVVNETFDGVKVGNPKRLKKISELKSVNPDLKILLSIGGWGAGRFSEMAADSSLRMSFINDCKGILAEFNIDGIDIDWEYPTVPAAGISCSPDDTKNFTLLMKGLRETLPEGSLVTFASVNSARFVDFKAVEPYLDFVNIMSYDMGLPEGNVYHNALYQSERTRSSMDLSVKRHIDAGLPRNKIVAGVPFYGRGNTKKGYTTFVDNNKMDSVFKGQTLMWDSVSMTAYYMDKQDSTLLCSFDTPRSMVLKCDYIKDSSLRGIMYWEYGIDGHVLRDVISTEMLGK